MTTNDNDKVIRICNIPAELHRRFKVRCAQDGVDMTKKIIGWIIECVEGGERK